jgi:hypothetical protein
MGQSRQPGRRTTTAEEHEHRIRTIPTWLVEVRARRPSPRERSAACWVRWFLNQPVVWLLWLTVTVATGAMGCRPANTSPSQPTDSPERRVVTRPPVDETLGAMIRAYQQALAYSDRGEIQLSYRSGGRLHRDVAPFSVAFQRPGKLQMQAYQVDLASDGEILQAQIHETASSDLSGQVVRRETPMHLTLPWLYEDNLLRETLQLGLGRQPIQLELLLAEQPIAEFCDSNVSRRYLDDRPLHGHSCYRLEVLTSEGPFVFWIDRQQWLLRRLEYPTNQLRQTMDPRLGVSDLSLVAEFHDSQFAAMRDRFLLTPLAEGARPLRRFVRPSQPLPSNLFGQTPAPFTLFQLDDRPLSSDSLQGKIVVLHWYVDHPACQASLELVERTRRQWAQDEQVVVYAVNAEGAATPRESLERTMAGWGFEIPILRDREAVGRDAFEIEVLPAIVVLGMDGTIQLHESTFNPRLDEHLAEALTRLRAGEDLGLAVVAQAHQDTVQYQRLLAAASSPEGPPTHPVSLISPSEPEKLRIQRLWSCSELSSPGNLVTVSQSSGARRLLALQGGIEIAELDLRGKVQSRNALPVSGDERLSLLRGAVGRSGELHMVAAEWGGQRIYLLNERFQLAWTGPPPGLRHDGILDVQFADVTGNGDLDVCVLLSGAGFVAWDLSGNEVARFATLAGVSLAGVPFDADAALDESGSYASGESSNMRSSAWGVHVATENGRIAHVTAAQPPRAVDPHPRASIFELYISNRPAGSSRYVGISFDAQGQRLARGLTRHFQEVWSYRLPGGVHSKPIQWALDIPWLNGGDGGWCFVSPDGAVHFVGDDGEFHDFFFPGHTVTGLGQDQTDQGPLLLLASDGLIECWGVQRP